MKILRNYLLKEFFKVLSVSIISLSSFYIIVDFISNVGAFTKHSPNFSYIILYFLLKLPEIIYRILPLSILLSTMLIIISFNKNNEITAIKSSGISMLKFTLPLIITAFGLSIFSFALSNFIAVKTNIERRIVMQKDINKNNNYSVKSIYKFKTKDIAIHYQEYIITAKVLNISEKKLAGLSVYEFNNKFKLVKRYSAKNGYFVHNKLIMDDVIINNFNKNQHYPSFAKIVKTTSLPIKLSINFFKSYDLKSEFLSIFNLFKMLKVAKKTDSNLNLIKTFMYSKFAFPLINLMLVLIGISIGIIIGKKSGTSAAIGISIILAFGYWIINSIAISLGMSSQLNPILAAFMADLSFLFIAIYLISDLD